MCIHIYIYIHTYTYIYIYIYIWNVPYRSLRTKQHSLFMPALALQSSSSRGKLLSSPWLSALQASLLKGIILWRSVFYTDTGMPCRHGIAQETAARVCISYVSLRIDFGGMVSVAVARSRGMCHTGVCEQIYIYIYIYICVYACMCIYMHTCVYIHIYIYIYTCMHISLFLSLSLYIYIYIYICLLEPWPHNPAVATALHLPSSCSESLSSHTCRVFIQTCVCSQTPVWSVMSTQKTQQYAQKRVRAHNATPHVPNMVSYSGVG